jgi:hypothetical protein
MKTDHVILWKANVAQYDVIEALKWHVLILLARMGRGETIPASRQICAPCGLLTGTWRIVPDLLDHLLYR